MLLTNWHVLTGLDAETRHTISADGATPTTCDILYRTLPDGVIALVRAGRLTLENDDGERLFAEHPLAQGGVDVGALRLPDDAFAFVVPVDSDILPYEPVYGPGDDLFILGYPGGIGGGFHYPVWKRGSIASEVTYERNGYPSCLLDTASSAGMSGAPVIFRQHSYLAAGDHGAEEGYPYVVGRTAQQFVGIYSGRIARLAGDPSGAQLGITWLREAIEPVIDAATELPAAPFEMLPVDVGGG